MADRWVVPKKKMDLLNLIAELKEFEEHVISEYCVELGDNLECYRFCGDDDCVIVRTIEMLERLVADGKEVDQVHIDCSL